MEETLVGGYVMEGAYFGTSATPMLLLANPRILKTRTDPLPKLKIFGFEIHPNSKLNLRANQIEGSQAAVIKKRDRDDDEK